MEEALNPHPAAALVAVLTELHTICRERGQMVSAVLRLPAWDNEALTGELELVSIDVAFPVRVVVSIPWDEAMEAAVASSTPSGVWAARFCWERVPAPEWEFADIPAIAELLRDGLEALPGCMGLTIEIPMIFDDTSWGLGTIELRHEWTMDLADLAEPEARQTVLESIAAHAIDGLRWLSMDHQLPAVSLALSA